MWRVRVVRRRVTTQVRYMVVTVVFRMVYICMSNFYFTDSMMYVSTFILLLTHVDVPYMNESKFYVPSTLSTDKESSSTRSLSVSAVYLRMLSGGLSCALVLPLPNACVNM